MTHVLYPGDQIHLAMPFNASNATDAEFERMANEARKVYREHGVQIPWVSFNSNLTAPVVVAVFRAATRPASDLLTELRKEIKFLGGNVQAVLGSRDPADPGRAPN